jgi:hypothetical protein
MDDFPGDSNERSHDDRGARPEWPGDGSVTVYYSMSAEIEVERQALAARWHRLRRGGPTPQLEAAPALARIIDDFPAIRARLAELRTTDGGGLAALPRQFSATVLDPDWLNGVQAEIRHELAAADRSPTEAEAGPSPNLILDDPV